MPELLTIGNADSKARLLLAHGAGAPMTSPFLETMAGLIAAEGVGVTRFEFGYMAGRRRGAPKRPPPKAERLMPEFIDAVGAVERELKPGERLFIGGKSMGGRVATMVADELYRAGRIGGVVVFGYPFHPPNQPQTWRKAHLTGLEAPTLIVQGERDPFGPRAEVEAQKLSGAIAFAWAHDGDHDLGPRGGQGTTRKENMKAAAGAAAAFILRLALATG